MPTIRDARVTDLPGLLEIERAAGEVFRTVGMAAVADVDPSWVERLLEFQRDGRAWVWADDRDRAGAYLIAEWLDGAVHVEQVSVHPAYARRRIGRGLIEYAAAWARDRQAPALTLTTFAEVAWNAPYYERCGFRRLAEEELTSGLQRRRAEEAAHGLDAWPRVVMRRPL